MRITHNAISKNGIEIHPLNTLDMRTFREFYNKNLHIHKN